MWVRVTLDRQACLWMSSTARTEEENCIMAYETSVAMKIKCGKPLGCN